MGAWLVRIVLRSVSVTAVFAASLAASPVPEASPTAGAGADPLAFFVGRWTCLTAAQNIVHETFTAVPNGLDFTSTYGPPGDEAARKNAERWRMRGAQIDVVGRIENGDGRPFAAVGTSHGWDGDTLRFQGAATAGEGAAPQVQVIRRLDEATYDRIFGTPLPPNRLVVTSISRCARGTEAPKDVPKLDEST